MVLMKAKVMSLDTVKAFIAFCGTKYAAHTLVVVFKGMNMNNTMHTSSLGR